MSDDKGLAGSNFDTSVSKISDRGIANNTQSNAQLVKRMHRIGKNWAMKAVQHNLNYEQVCQGVVNSILQQLDNGSTTCPAFQLVPIPYNPLELDHGFYPEVDGNADYVHLHNWNYGTPLATEGKLAKLHADHYERFRDRLSISAVDLFS